MHLFSWLVLPIFVLVIFFHSFLALHSIFDSFSTLSRYLFFDLCPTIVESIVLSNLFVSSLLIMHITIFLFLVPLLFLCFFFAMYSFSSVNLDPNTVFIYFYTLLRCSSFCLLIDVVFKAYEMTYLIRVIFSTFHSFCPCLPFCWPQVKVWRNFLKFMQMYVS